MHRLLIAALCLFACQAVPAGAADGEWSPDAALVAKIETAFQATMTNGGLTDIGDHPVTASEPLDHYARYYAGETVKGERIVVGALMLGFGGSPGIHIVTMHQLPDGDGGGCGMMHLWYHVDSQKIESVCNFPE